MEDLNLAEEHDDLQVNFAIPKTNQALIQEVKRLSLLRADIAERVAKTVEKIFTL